MREAARQKHHEILFDYTCTGIFGALMLSVVLVLLSRLGESGVSANIPVAILLVADVARVGHHGSTAAPG